jgi:hypothetical protein
VRWVDLGSVYATLARTRAHGRSDPEILPSPPTLKSDSESPTDSMLRDAPFMIDLLDYVVAIVAITYESW